jgi:hypothetical protein
MKRRGHQRSAEAMVRMILAVAMAACISLAGCKPSTAVGPSGAKTKSATKAVDEEVPFKSITGEEVHFAGGKPVALPADFPADVAIYPKATVVRWSKGNEGIGASLKTADSAKDAEAFYRESLKKDGWELDKKVKVPRFLKATKQGRTLSVDISTQSGETTIDLTIAKLPAKP